MPELLAELFSSKVRAAVLALMLPRPHLGFSLTDLSRRLGLPVSSLQHECYKLNRLGLLKNERVGSARRYRPDAAFPLLPPLTALTLRAIPLDEALRGAAEGMGGVDCAWVAGNLDARDGPVYLVVVGGLELETLDGLFDRVRTALEQSISAHRLELAYYLPNDWDERMQAGDPFVAALHNDRAIDLVTTSHGQPPSTSRLA